MRFAPTILALAVAFGTVRADNCGIGGSTELDGNYYCAAVNAIHYSNVGTPGTYNRVTDMTDGVCSSTPNAFRGPIAPLDEEASVHFRGPIAVKQFAAYGLAVNVTTASSTAAPAPTSTTAKAFKHLAQHVHKHRRRSGVTATIDSVAVEWQNDWFGPLKATGGKVPGPATVTATIDGQVVNWLNNWFGPSTATVAPTATSAPAPTLTSITTVINPSGLAPGNVGQAFNQSSFPAGTYARIGYYNAEAGTSENLTFIGNYGNQNGSGVFDESFGASTAYLNAEGTGGAAEPQILSNTLVPSAKEFAIFTDSPCVAGDSCGYVRPGSVAYHGFQGADKIFLMEFQMPMDGLRSFLGDMPAIWMLNAQIPRTLQYGEAACSCWESGCGEFDIMEVLSSGSKYCKSTLHTNTPAGDSDYILRPTDAAMKIAVFFHSPTSAIRIQTLPDKYIFGSTINEAAIAEIMTMAHGPELSEFKVVA